MRYQNKFLIGNYSIGLLIGASLILSTSCTQEQQAGLSEVSKIHFSASNVSQLDSAEPTDSSTENNPETEIAVLENLAASDMAVKLCFKRLRLKPVEVDELIDEEIIEVEPSEETLSLEEEIEDNFDYELGLIELDATASFVDALEIPEGEEFRRIEFDLNKNCENNSSVSFSLEGEEFSTDDRIKIKFEGEFGTDIKGALVRATQAIMKALSNHNSETRIKDLLKDAGGDL